MREDASRLPLRAALFFRKANARPGPRLGVTIQARVNSVLRNRVKRVVREEFRLAASHLGAFDYLLIVRRDVRVDHLYVGALREELRRTLAKLGGASVG